MQLLYQEPQCHSTSIYRGPNVNNPPQITLYHLKCENITLVPRLWSGTGSRPKTLLSIDRRSWHRSSLSSAPSSSSSTFTVSNLCVKPTSFFNLFTRRTIFLKPNFNFDVFSASARLVFEEGYTVSTVLDGNKLNVNPYFILPRSDSSDFLVLDSEHSAFFTVAFTPSQGTHVNKALLFLNFCFGMIFVGFALIYFGLTICLEERSPIKK